MKGASKEGNVRFIALLSALAGHYHWPPDFWRKMGRREFYAWVDQLWKERQNENSEGGQWEQAENDPGWQAMRDRRERMRGR